MPPRAGWRTRLGSGIGVLDSCAGFTTVPATVPLVSFAAVVRVGSCRTNRRSRFSAATCSATTSCSASYGFDRPETDRDGARVNLVVQRRRPRSSSSFTVSMRSSLPSFSSPRLDVAFDLRDGPRSCLLAGTTTFRGSVSAAVRSDRSRRFQSSDRSSCRRCSDAVSSEHRQITLLSASTSHPVGKEIPRDQRWCRSVRQRVMEDLGSFSSRAAAGVRHVLAVKRPGQSRRCR